jgi:aspartokinase
MEWSLRKDLLGPRFIMKVRHWGREGSDYTAAILAYALDATAVTIWKDVPGI